MTAIGAAAVALAVGTAVAIPPLVAERAAGEARAAAATDAVAAERAAVSLADAVLAAVGEPVDPVVVEDLQSARDAVDSGGEVASTQVSDALTGVRAAIVEQGTAALSTWPEAEKSTEDALYAGIQGVQEAHDADLPDAVAAVLPAIEAVRTSAQEYREQLAAAGSGTQPVNGDVDAQLSYLLTHAHDYNTEEWGDYNPYGGDCANFVSQGLIARGWQMDATWSSGGAMWTASDAWISSPAMDAYLSSLGLGYTTQDDLDRVRVGDVGVFDWGETGAGQDHVMTVSKVEYTPDGPRVYFASHNADGEYRELLTALHAEHDDSSVKIYAIP